MGDFEQALGRATTATVDGLLAQLPQLLGAVALLLVGWLLARLLRLVTRRGAALLDSLITRSTGQSRWRVGRSATVLGIVGAGGIGVVLWEMIRGFYFAQTCAIMILIIISVPAIGLVSQRLRKLFV